MFFQVPSAKTVASTLASIAATAVILRSVLRDHVPPELRRYLRSKLAYSLSSRRLTLVIQEFDDTANSSTPNHIFRAAKTYLNNPETARLKAGIIPAANNKTTVTTTMDSDQETVDFFAGIKLTWKRTPGPPDRFELSFHKSHRDAVLESYLPHILEKAKEQSTARALKIHALKDARARRMMMMTWRRRGRGTAAARECLWDSAAFETVAMETEEAKEAVVEDLRRFSGSRERYRRSGRAWRRGYLLVGPAGTGKSSLVAAMANYLKFDVYDLQLSRVRNNAELRKVLLSVGSRSVIVVEDIDCANDGNPAVRGGRSGRRSKVTFSGLLNLMDGLWSSSGDERIVVLTSSRKDGLDPALLRPGRMDVHIHLSHCTPCGFKMLASTHLGLAHHRLFPEIERLAAAVKVTPAEVSGELLKSEDPEASLAGLIELLRTKEGKM